MKQGLLQQLCQSGLQIIYFKRNHLKPLLEADDNETQSTPPEIPLAVAVNVTEKPIYFLINLPAAIFMHTQQFVYSSATLCLTLNLASVYAGELVMRANES